MDLTMLAAYASLVCGNLIMDSPDRQATVRRLLRNGRFAEMVVVLEKYYTFMNLTNSVSVGRILMLHHPLLEFHFNTLLSTPSLSTSSPRPLCWRTSNRPKR